MERCTDGSAFRPPAARRAGDRSGDGARRDRRCRRHRREDRGDRGGYSAGGRGRGDRCRRQAGDRRDDRHPCARLPARHRAVRLAAGPGRRALRRHHRGRSGRTELHDAGWVSPFHCRTGRDARAVLHLRLSGGWAGGAPVSGTLWTRPARRAGDGEGGARQCRPGARHQGACRDRRRLALGFGSDQARQGDFAPGRDPAVYPSRPAMAGAGRRDGRCR